MTPVAYLALLGWIPLVVVMFAALPSRRAATIAVIGAWLVLPPYTIQISSLPDFSRNMAATVGMLLSTVIFAPDRILGFRPRWFDLPMFLWCFCGIASSLQNGLGIYDGLSDSLNQSLYWGLPYLLGRLYFGTPEDLRYFAVGMAIGGLCYVPPCIWESRMSPNLLKDVYGAASWAGTRLGGYRPHVFFWTGLECGMWMTAASLAGWWMWRCGALKKVRDIPFGKVLLPILLATTVLCRSTGALALLLAGVMLLWLSARFRTRWLLAGLLLVAPVYAGVRLTNLWTGQSVVELAKTLVNADRAQSLEYRFMCENLLSRRALQQPVFGWGGWNRSDVYFAADTEWKKKVPTDGLWIIILGMKGFVGLTLFYVAFVLPAFLFVWRFPARLWADPRLAAGSLAAGLLAVYMIDCLLNGFINIIYVTLAGGLSSLEPKQLRAIPAAGHGIDAEGRRGGGVATRADAAAIGAGAAAPLRPDGPGGSLPHPGPVVQAGRAAARSGGRLAAGPRPARCPPRSQSRRRRSAAAVVRLRQRPGLAVGQSPRPVPPQPGVRRVDGPPGDGRIPRGPGLLEHAGGRPLPRRRRPRGGRTPSIAPGPWAAARPSTTSSWPWRTRGWATRRKPGRRWRARCSRRNATTRATPSWPASATRPGASSTATPPPRSRSIDTPGALRMFPRGNMTSMCTLSEDTQTLDRARPRR